MEFLNYILGNSFHIHIFLAAIMFSGVWKKRDNFFIRCIVIFGIYFILPFFGLFSCDILIFDWLNLGYLIAFFGELFALWGCFKLSVNEVLFFGIASYAIQNAADCLARLMSIIVIKLAGQCISGVYEMGNEEIFELLFHISEMCSIAIIYCASYKLFVKRLIKGETVNIQKKSLIITLCITIMLVYVCSLYTTNDLSMWLPTKIYGFACCGLILCLQFSLFEKSKLAIKNESLERILYLNGVQHQYSRETIEIINRKCHDLKHQIRTIRKQEGEVDKNYLKEIESAIMMYDSLSTTGNPALDVIISEKRLLCEKYGIIIASIIDGKVLNYIDDADIYSLFGNILDNAMKAVSELENKEQRIINLNVTMKGNMIVIHQDNGFVGDIKFEDGLPVTTNENKDIHGFGVSSIRYITQKYGGSLSFVVNNGFFELNILLPIKN